MKQLPSTLPPEPSKADWEAVMQKDAVRRDVPRHQTAPGHEQAVLCSRMARLLHYGLTGIDWPGLRFADRSRLYRALAHLQSDIELARTIAGDHRPTGNHCHQAGRPKIRIGRTKAAASGNA